MEIQRGMRDKLEKYVDTTKMIEVKLNIVGNAVYDFSCFGVDINNKLSDDRYMVFYNQKTSPNGEIEYIEGNNSAVFKVMTNSIPAAIQKLVFTASIDGVGTMGEIAAHTISVNNEGAPPALTAHLQGTSFNVEKAIISIELYRKNEWRFALTASGFNGGIADLLHYYGGTSAEEAALTAPPEPETPPEPPKPEPPKPAVQPEPTVQPVRSEIPEPPQPAPQPEQPFAQPQPQFGQPQPQFGQPQAQFGQPQAQFGMPQPQFGQPQPQFGQPQPQFGQPQPQFNQPINQGYGYGGHTQQPNRGMPVQPPFGGQPQFGQPVPPQQNMGGQPSQPFGGAPAPSAPKKVSLEKKLSSAPALVSLAKPIMVQLEKKNLTDTTARVALVMDITGSMYMAYKNGVVQEIVNKILPLAVQFDDDGALDFWYYAKTFDHRPPVDLNNYQTAVPADWKDVMNGLGGSNNEPAVMEDVIEFYRGTSQPVYIIFITDGGMAKKGEIKKLMKQASEMPLFWQFVGVDGSNYGLLENLDELEGRFVDNAGFFALDDFMAVSNDELYDRLLNEFPIWLNEVKRLGLIR